MIFQEPAMRLSTMVCRLEESTFVPSILMPVMRESPSMQFIGGSMENTSTGTVTGTVTSGTTGN
ncbi:hypothetical protein P9228_07640 [Mesorhizobium sp. WSM4898]|uniref:hypothetical protein n=1 Tax=unclassified Mesorhizobium TaxID=325217 RepID=UPI0024159631|nr:MULTISPECIES: hypothetical protein [unclassified Mesorhizobium]MDG4906312.1 hypothetical protein [Mesorhizobium sp. WSM4898]